MQTQPTSTSFIYPYLLTECIFFIPTIPNSGNLVIFSPTRMPAPHTTLPFNSCTLAGSLSIFYINYPILFPCGFSLPTPHIALFFNSYILAELMSSFYINYPILFPCGFSLPTPHIVLSFYSYILADSLTYLYPHTSKLFPVCKQKESQTRFPMSGPSPNHLFLLKCGLMYILSGFIYVLF